MMFKALLLCLLVAVWGCAALQDCPEVDDPADPILFEDPDDCGAFYECAYGKAFQFKCQQGLYYDDSLKRCDYPSEVACGTRPTTTVSPVA
ncbi:hypothetical protein D910_06803 [Dendroctonus ponderosae]